MQRDCNVITTCDVKNGYLLHWLLFQRDNILKSILALTVGGL